MIRMLLDYLARHPSLTRDPSRAERIILHALYLVSLGEVAYLMASMLGKGRGIGSEGLDYVFTLAVSCSTFMFWSVVQRRIRTEMWFIAHLIWLAWAHVCLASLFVGTLLLMAGVAIFALAFPPIVFLIYAPWLVGWPVALWFGWRAARGYLAYVRGEGIGGYHLPRGTVRNWGIYKQAAIIPDMRGAVRRGPSATPPPETTAP